MKLPLRLQERPKGYPVILTTDEIAVVKTDCSLGSENWFGNIGSARRNARNIIQSVNNHDNLFMALKETAAALEKAAEFIRARARLEDDPKCFNLLDEQAEKCQKMAGNARRTLKETGLLE